MSQFSFGHIVRFDRRLKSELRFWQNFFIGEKITYANKEYKFAAFGFSGVTVNRTGDGLEAALVFPNNELTRRFAVKAVDDSYLVEVDVLISQQSHRCSFVRGPGDWRSVGRGIAKPRTQFRVGRCWNGRAKAIADTETCG